MTFLKIGNKLKKKKRERSIMYWLTNTSFIVPYDNEMELAKKF